MSVELTVTLKDSERNFKQKFLIYQPITLNPNDDDKVIQSCIEEAKINFQGEPEDIVVRAMMICK